MPSTSKVISTLATGFALLIGSGCGSDSDSPSTSASGINPSRPANSLTDTEVKQLCKAVDGFFNEPALNEVGCKVSSVIAAALFAAGGTDAELQMTCSSAYDECIKGDGKESPGAGASTSGQCKKPSASCTATVGEIEQCLADMKTSFANLGKSLPACNTLTKASLSQGSLSSAEPPEPASCKTLEKKCPDIELPENK